MEKKYCKKYKKTHHYLPVFGENINFVFSKDDFLYLCEEYQNFVPDRELSNNGECFMNYKNGDIIIGIFNNDLPTLVHELTHASIFILNYRQMNVSDSEGECMAYIQAYLFDIGHKRMNKKGK